MIIRKMIQRIDFHLHNDDIFWIQFVNFGHSVYVSFFLLCREMVTGPTMAAICTLVRMATGFHQTEEPPPQGEHQTELQVNKSIEFNYESIFFLPLRQLKVVILSFSDIFLINIGPVANSGIQLSIPLILMYIITDYGHPERAFFKNSKFLGLGRQIGPKFYEAFGVFLAKL